MHSKTAFRKISIFKNVGAILGGTDTKPLNSISPIPMPIRVIMRTPRIIAPGTFLTAKIEIIKNPRADNNVSIWAKLPKDKKVASLETIRPPLFNPITKQVFWEREINPPC